MGANRRTAVGTLTPTLKRELLLGSSHPSAGSGDTAFWSWRHGLLLLNGKIFIIFYAIGQGKNDKRFCYGDLIGGGRFLKIF